jgi:hypothetical protein
MKIENVQIARRRSSSQADDSHTRKTGGRLARAGTGEADGDATGLRYRKFLDLEGDGLWFVFGHDVIGDIGDEPLKEFPVAIVAVMNQLLRDIGVVDGFLNAIAYGSRGEIVREIDGDQQALGFGSFFVRDANAVRDF